MIKTMKEYEGKIRQVLSYMPYAEIMYVSALTGQRLPKLYDMIDMVIENQTLRIATGVTQRDHDRGSCYAAATVR